MGLFDWIGKKKDDVKEEGKRLVGAEEIKKNASFMYSMGKILFNPKEATKNAKRETFLEAKKRLNINENDILQVYKNNVISFYISLLFGLICLFLIFFNAFNLNILGFATSLSIFLICLTQCFKFSFRSFQIRHQKLCSVSDWAKRPGDWFPTIS